MKKKNLSAQNVIAFIAVLLLVIFLVNFIYTTFILPQKTFYRKESLYQNYTALSGGRIEYLVLGDSHAFHAVNPAYVPGAYNYASGAENYIKSFYKLRKVLEKDNESVGAVILELDPHTFSTRLTDETNLFNELELYSQFVSLYEVQHVRNDFLIRLWLEANMPFIGNGKEFGVLLKKTEFNEISAGGWLKNKENFSLVDKNASALFNYKSLYENQERISNVSFEYFIKTIKLAQQHNVPVIFVSYPHTLEYDQIITEKNVTKEDYYARIFTEVDKTLGNYTFLNYYSLFPEKDYLFGDPEHVNYIGSELFSRQLYSDLENLEVAPPREKTVIETKRNSESIYGIYLLLTLAILELGVLLFLLSRMRVKVSQTDAALP
ncbi:MAG: hypothetical protein AABX53_02855 [Nanoarchaeota archaeon]